VSGALVVLRWELVKLGTQLRVRVVVLACLLGPPALALGLGLRLSGPPVDTVYGRYVLDSGPALSLLVLGFAGMWVLPLLAGVVAGDLFASEDAAGTWKTVLTRDRSRDDLFVGKVLAAVTAVVALLALLALSSLAAGLLLAGTRPLVGLSGQLIAPGRAVVLTLLSWLLVLPPLLGFTAVAVALSVLTRSSVAGVAGPVLLGLLLQVLSLVGGLGLVRHALLTTPFSAWHGLLTSRVALGSFLQGAVLCALHLAVLLPLARRALLRRDVAAA